MRLLLTLQPRFHPFIIGLAFKLLIKPWTIRFISTTPQNLICKYNLQPETQTAIAADWNSVREKSGCIILYLVSLNEMAALVKISTKHHRFIPEVQYSQIVPWCFPEGGKDFSQRRRNNGLINHKLLELQITVSNQLSKHVPTSLCNTGLLSFLQPSNVILLWFFV